MDPMQGPTLNRQPRSGGKVLRHRRTERRKTPYDRPSLPDNRHENPNWVSRLIVSPTRKIATGAGKLLASVFVSDSSSSEEEEEDAFASDYDLEENQDNAVSLPVDEMTKENQLLDDAQQGRWRKQTKQVIEQLLMKETFTREECDRLASIIKSRVVDDLSIVDFNDKQPSGGFGTADISTETTEPVLEAKKYLEKRSGSKAKLDFGSPALAPCTSANGIGSIGTPDAVAKSFMQARSRWISPSNFSAEIFSPSSSKRSSSSAGLWSIQDELRKVRSKATEEMLRNISSSEADKSASALKLKQSADALNDVTTKTVDKENVQNIQNTSSASLNPDSVSNVSPGIQDSLKDDPYMPKQLTIGSDSNQIVEANQGVEGGGAALHHESFTNRGTGDHLQEADLANLSERREVDVTSSALAFNGNGPSKPVNEVSAVNGLAAEDMVETGSASACNGFPLVKRSFMSPVDSKPETMVPCDEGNYRAGSGNSSLSASADDETLPEAAAVNENKDATANENESLTLSSSTLEGLMEEDTESGSRSGRGASPGRRTTGKDKSRGKKEAIADLGRRLRPRKQ